MLGIKRDYPWDREKDVPIYEHTYATRVRVPEPLESQSEHCAALGYVNFSSSLLPFIPSPSTLLPCEMQSRSYADSLRMSGS
jgi:hypothetical protein